VSKPPVMADSRDMIVIHQMFRWEFQAIPALVSVVPAGDGPRAGLVADHITWMVAFLHPEQHRGPRWPSTR